MAPVASEREHPVIEPEQKIIRMGDIARIDANDAVTFSIKNIIVPARACADGLIDRAEVIKTLKKHTREMFLIFGTAVRIQQARVSDVSNNDDGKVAVKQGKTVRFIVRKNGITIEVPGKILKNSYVGDITPVKLKKYGTVKGRVLNEEEVELCL